MELCVSDVNTFVQACVDKFEDAFKSTKSESGSTPLLYTLVFYKLNNKGYSYCSYLKGYISHYSITWLPFRFQLKPYQLIGLKWLLLLHEHKLSGILADEMVRQ